MKKPLLFLLLSVLFCHCGVGQADSARILNHIKVLSDDSKRGRATGTGDEQAAAKYIKKVFTDLHLKRLGPGGYLQRFPFRKGIHGQGGPGVGYNVVAYLDNGASTTVIFGAHYDHLGTDGQGSSLEPNPENKIHNGADDNASGVAGVLELARYFSSNNVSERNNFLFLCFSGEELGLVGSKYFADNPLIDLSKVNYMINMDMIGRMDKVTRSLIVHGTGTSPVWEPLLKQASHVNIRMDSSGTGPSDHTSFYLKGIPVLHFFTGGHSDYHKPSDDWQKINASGEADVLNLIIDIVEALDAQPKLEFLKTKSKSLAGPTSFKVTLGIMPSYAGEVDGLKVDAVSDNKPAQKAGIVSGDIILMMGEHSIHNIQDYMDALNKFEKGQTIPVKVRRGEEIVTVTVAF